MGGLFLEPVRDDQAALGAEHRLDIEFLEAFRLRAGRNEGTDAEDDAHRA